VTDLEITRLCAEAMGYSISRSKYQPHTQVWVTPPHSEQSLPAAFLYAPLHDDAQAMALVKKFPMTIEHPSLTVGGKEWHVESVEIVNGICPDVYAEDLNRAICECVAKLKQGEDG
jgi:hypothetical protein